MLCVDVWSFCGVLFMYEYKDYMLGLDDVCVFNFFEDCDMEIYCFLRVEEVFWWEYGYVFGGNNYFGILQFYINMIGRQFFLFLDYMCVVLIEVMYYKFLVIVFCIGDFVYVIDVKMIMFEELEKFKGVKVFIINVFCRELYFFYFNEEEVIEQVCLICFEIVYLMYIFYLYGKYVDIEVDLFVDVCVVYDGL